MNEEQKRINNLQINNLTTAKWGPYLSERQWGTVREDYSENGDAWNYFTHDQARSRSYLWGEDGIAGISDRFQNLCFSLAMWNTKDPILKERLFGLTNNEGNHGEDVKELYYYLDNVPSHYYMKYLYKYTQHHFPYDLLKSVNKNLTKLQPEYEILDTEKFNDYKYFDVIVEYAKQTDDDIFIKISITNYSTIAAPILILPTLLFYNRWQYGGLKQKPVMELINENTVKTTHERLGNFYFYCLNASDILFTENETNTEKIYDKPNASIFVKDAFHDAIIEGKNYDALKNQKKGTKCSPIYNLTIESNQTKCIYLRLSNDELNIPFGKNFEKIFDKRKQEADEFYNNILPKEQSDDFKNIQRQAFAGLLWNKQYYHYDVERWLKDSNSSTSNTPERQNGRNSTWKNLKNQDIILMPDKWEYPWYASWDSAFHCIAIGKIDPYFAKSQLLLLTREWYMNPAGQIPAYEWNFNDVNPPVHAYSAIKIYENEKENTGVGDIFFLKKIFQKLIINFTWWVNRKDSNGNNVFEGGFLGLDNIGVFNRSIQLPDEISLEQADGTSWVGMYAINMMEIALEIALQDNAFEDLATKFYEHFVIIAEALNEMGLWNVEDNFFYDLLCLKNQPNQSLKVKSIVGATPLFAATIMNKNHLNTLIDFKNRIEWFNNYRIINNKYLPNEDHSTSDDILLSLVHKEKLVQILNKLFDESEFLSTGGIRSLSKIYETNPYQINIENTNYSIQYDPGDSTSGMFGGNSNWRGPIWIPINYMIIKAIKKYGEFYGNSLQIECPKGSGKMLNLTQASNELAQRLMTIFLKDNVGNRPIFGRFNWFYQQPENKDLLLFYEYFHGNTLQGLGANHQTGWSALIVDLF